MADASCCSSCCWCCAAQVFLQRAAVNLLSTVMDIPEFFWSAPDHLQVRGGHEKSSLVFNAPAMKLALSPCVLMHKPMNPAPSPWLHLCLFAVSR
jgi:hypothetical protein